MRHLHGLAVCLALVSILSACGGDKDEAVTGGGAGGGLDVSGGDVGFRLGDTTGTDAVKGDTGTVGKDAGGKDTAGKDGGAGDVSADTALPTDCPGGVGCDCAGPKDCGDFAACVQTPAGKKCAPKCGDKGVACGEGSVCGKVDGTDVCLPEHGRSCQPCDDSKGCAFPSTPGAACVSYGAAAGSFCAVPCTDDAACPEGSTCQDATTAEGTQGKFCRVKADDKGAPGACGCDVWAAAEGLSTTCAVSADIGGQTASCKGTRVCSDKGLSDCSAATPVAETCDGVDQDCDGQTDEAGDTPLCDDNNPCTADTCAGKDGCKSSPTNAPCEADGDACTSDACENGACAKGSAKDCDDGNGCTANACDPKTGDCTASFLPAGATCTDDDACTESDACKDGKCAGAPLNCDDNNPCTTDSCDKGGSGGGGGCVNTNTTAPCDDGNACTAGEVCAAGACGGGTDKVCDDNNPCTTDSCDTKTGKCVATPLSAKCDDGTLCTKDDACKDGTCTGTPIDCSDDNPCTTNSCDPKTGCTFDLNASPCDDKNKCTDFDKCSKGKCKGVAKEAADCDDNNPCTTDSCDMAVGCTHTNNTASCTDGNACTNGDSCKDGKCAAGTNICQCQNDGDCAKNNPDNACLGTLYCDKSTSTFVCKLNPATVVSCPSGGDTACAANQCDPKDGKCKVTAINEGKACDADGTVCTAGDKCESGVCKAGAAVGCDDKNPCTNDACDPKAGCTYAANQALCDADGDACTVADQCSGKVCLAGKKKVCDDGELCSTDSCDTKTGKCVFSGAQQQGKPCDADGSLCTTGDACANGKCVAGKTLSCDDGNPCTIDSCDPKKGCVHADAASTCNADDDACTVGDKCVAGQCVAGTKKSCDDGDKCTADSCDKKTGSCKNTAIIGCGGNCNVAKDCDDGTICTTDACTKGKCVNTPKDGKCDDGTACTSGDACAGGKCVGKKVDCNDNNPCTDDSCDTSSGCVNSPNSVKCDDGAACTTGDVCSQGKCAGKTKVCDDGNKCTTDKCNPGDGACIFTGIPGCGGFCTNIGHCDDKNPCTTESCVGGKCGSAFNTAKCDDGDPCTEQDTCAGGNCNGQSKSCDDGNFCTTDSCDDKTGACGNVALPKDATCDDDSACTTGDTCVLAGGKVTCQGKAKVCDDGNTCTNDSCDKAKGTCVFTNASGACEDGDPCTHGDACAGGKCVSGDGRFVDTQAGSSVGYAEGKAAKFNYPYGVTHDPSGFVYLTDRYNHRIRRVAPDGTTTTFAGSGKAGLLNGKGAAAWFNQPFDVDRGPSGTLYVADQGNSMIRAVASDGTVTSFAGTGQAGSTNGATSVARFNGVYGVAAAKGGVVYVADRNNNRVRRIAGGQVTTFAGSSAGFADGKGTAARFRRPQGVAVDGSGFVWVTDSDNHRIRRISPDGAVTTVAGSSAGFTNGAASSARFNRPWGIDVAADGRVIIADRYNHRIRELSAGIVTTYAGGPAGVVDGLAAGARFVYPAGVSVDITGNVYVAGGNDHRLRRIRESGNSCTIAKVCYNAGMPNPANGCQACAPKTSASQWTAAKDGGVCQDTDLCTEKEACKAGQCAGSKKACDDGDKCTTDACDAKTGGCVNTPIVGCGGNCAKDSDCNDKNVCTTDTCSGGKCAFTPNTAACDDGDACSWGDVCSGGVCQMGVAVEVSTLAGSGANGHADGKGDKAKFRYPRGVSLAPDGSLVVADGHNHRIRRVAMDGTVTTVAGTGTAGIVDGPANIARFNYPSDVAVAKDGTIYVADLSNHRIRVISPKGQVSTLAGNSGGYVDGKGGAARFNAPYGIALGSGGVLYVADYNNHRIRKVTTDGVVTTLAGSSGGYADGKGSAAKFNRPLGIATDGHGTIFVADYNNHRIRKVSADGTVSTFAGSGTAGYQDGGAKTARFNRPWGVAVNSAGEVIVADRYNHRIRRISASGIVLTMASIGGGFADGDGGKTARFNQPWGVAVDALGNVYVGDYNNHRVRRVRDTKGACGVGGACYAAGMRKPGDSCQVCDAAQSAKAFSPAKDGLLCVDGDLCTHTDACKSGKCTAGSKPNCDDKITCTKDYCDAKTGACVNEVIVGCGSFCEVDAHCDDSNVCTSDTCVKGKCVYQNNGVACDDGNSCTLGDVCKLGKCTAGEAVWVTLAAGAGAGLTEGEGNKAKFNQPMGITPLGATQLVADSNNHRIRQIKGGVVSTYAGSTAGFLDGNALTARFNRPSDVAADAAGKVYVADRSNHRIRSIISGKVAVLAGGTAGYLDGKGASARFNNPYGVAATPGGVVYVADYSNNRVRKVLPDGTVTTLAGGSSGFADGTGTSARFAGPINLAVDQDGSIVVADHRNHRVRRVSPLGVVTTIAGGAQGYLEGNGTSAKFNYPWGVTIGSGGVIYVSDRSNHRIRAIAPSGATSLFAGNGVAGYVNGDGTGARFNGPRGLAFDAATGAIWIADLSNHRIRRAHATKTPCNIGGVCVSNGLVNSAKPCEVCDGAANAKGWTAQKDGAACSDGKLCTAPDTCKSGSCSASTKSCDDKDACTKDSCDVATGACVNTKIIGCQGYCESDAHCDDKNPCTNDACASNKCVNVNNTASCDDGNSCTTGDVCKDGACTPGIHTLVSTTTGTGSGYVDGAASKAKFNNPAGIVLMPDGSMVVADYSNHRVRKVAKDGTVTTLAGSGQQGFKDGNGAQAWFYRPTAVVTDGQGMIYVTDRYNHRVRAIDAQGNVTTLAGSSSNGYLDGTGTAARLNYPIGLSIYGGKLAVGDYSNHRIRIIDIASKAVTTLAGSSGGYADGTGNKAKFNGPTGVAFDSEGNLFVAEYSGHRIRKVTADGVVTTVAGVGTAGLTNGDAKQARFNRPWSLTVDLAGRIFVADRHNHRIRKIEAGTVTTVAGIAAGYVDGTTATARLHYPTGIAMDTMGVMHIADWSSHRIRKVVVTGGACLISGGCWAQGSANPANSCQTCGKATKAWSTTADGGSCADGKPCTTGDKCGQGSCSGGNKSCDDQDACTTDSCDAKTGACKHVAVPNCGG